MGIPSFIKRVCVQPAVYWGNPVNDGLGNFTYDDPIEIKCRWEDKIKIINNRVGQEEISNTEVLVNDSSEVSIGGILYLGTLLSLDDAFIEFPLRSDQVFPYPKQIENCHKVVSVDRIPLFRSTTKFVKIAYLKPNWETKL